MTKKEMIKKIQKKEAQLWKMLNLYSFELEEKQAKGSQEEIDEWKAMRGMAQSRWSTVYQLMEDLGIQPLPRKAN